MNSLTESRLNKTYELKRTPETGAETGLSCKLLREFSEN
jgi:hypothetical protein